MIGQILGHYRVLEQIGAGGMGLVFRAHDERLDRDVALKVLPPGTLSDENARRRFRKEALTLSKLNHPNIETVFDFDTQEGVDFLVMELIPGVTLDEKLAATGALPEKEVVRLGMQLAEGLAAAHAESVIHRDLKPGNLRQTPDGRLKVLDFGLAKLLGPVSDTAVTESLSKTHGAAGTLPYMAPEQLQGEPADARSDIWAAGAALYEMATGRRPFPQTSAPMLTDAILRQAAVPPRAVNANLSPELERIIAKSLEKDPEHRYQSAKELGADLRRLAAPPTAVPATKPAPGRRRYGWYALAAGGLVVTLLVVGMVVPQWEWRDRLLGKRGANRIESLAVLPLENLSRDPDQEYFADGITEALTTELAHISALRVISRTSVMHYKSTNKTVPEIARELNVDAVVQGSVVKAGNRVRITAQLIEAPTDRHLWAESYERDLGDVLSLQGEVSRTIARQIQVTLTPQEQTRLASARPVNPHAYELYLKGRFYWSKRTDEGLKKSVEYYNQALEEDPTYALAWAGLANTYLQMGGEYRLLPPPDARPRAKAAALKALDLDPNLGEAHASLGLWHYHQWEWTAADKEFKRALELVPNDATAYHWYALFLNSQGRDAEALQDIRRAQTLDPLSPAVGGTEALILYHARRYDEAIEKADKAVKLYPDFPQIHVWLGLAYVEKGRFQEGLANLEHAAALSHRHPAVLSRLGYAYGRAGRRADALRIAGELEEVSKQRYVSPFDRALVYAGLGEREQVLAWLEKAYGVRDASIIINNRGPWFDSVRDAPRFQALVRRLGLRPEDSPAVPAAGGVPKAPPPN